MAESKGSVLESEGDEDGEEEEEDEAEDLGSSFIDRSWSLSSVTPFCREAVDSMSMRLVSALEELSDVIEVEALFAFELLSSLVLDAVSIMASESRMPDLAPFNLSSSMSIGCASVNDMCDYQKLHGVDGMLQSKLIQVDGENPCLLKHCSSSDES